MTRLRVKNLVQVLSHSLGENSFEILDEKYCALTKPGEHYGSIMLALDLTIRNSNGEEEVLKLVAKLIPANQMLREAFDIPVTFKKEVFAYTVSIPTLVKFQTEYHVPEEKLLDIFPKCFGARISLDPNKGEVDKDGVLIFENLKIQGYATDDRMAGFDFQSAKLIIKDLAKFHAIPIALRMLKPEVFKKNIIPSTIMNRQLEEFPEEPRAAFHNSVLDTMKALPELHPYIQRVQEIFKAKIASAGKPRPPPNETFATWLHADYWVSNTMMLRDEHGNPLKCKMVDLQLMLYGSAVRDLVFFLFTSVRNDVLKKYFNDFVGCYHDSLVDNLSDFGVNLNPFSLENLLRELEEVGPQEVYHVLLMLKPIFTEQDKVQNSLEEFKDDDWNSGDLLGEAHRNKVRDTILEFAEKKWI